MMAEREAPRWLPMLIVVVLGAVATYLIGLLLSPLFPAIVTSAVIATLCYPAHQRVARLIPQKDFAALATTTLVFVLVLIPAFALSVALISAVRSGIDWLPEVARDITAREGTLDRWWSAVAAQLGVEERRLGDALSEQLRDFVALLARRTLRFLSGLGGWLLQLGAAAFTLFYLLRDGETLMKTLKWLVPLDPELTDRLTRQAHDVILATVYGNVVVALVQGALGGLAFWALGLPAAALWGSVMALLSLLPVVGAFLVWAPAALILIVGGDVLRGIVLLAFGAAVISTIDNYLRALLVGDRAHLHPLVVFFSVLGGLVIFGAVGIVVGPVMFVVALSLVEMARQTLEVVPAAEAAGAPVHARESPLTGSFFTRPEETAGGGEADSNDPAG